MYIGAVHKITDSSSLVGISCRLLTRMPGKPVWGLLYPLKDTLPSVGKFQHSCLMCFTRLSTSEANECAAVHCVTIALTLQFLSTSNIQEETVTCMRMS
jgi:hypothetical protein